MFVGPGTQRAQLSMLATIQSASTMTLGTECCMLAHSRDYNDTWNRVLYVGALTRLAWLACIVTFEWRFLYAQMHYTPLVSIAVFSFLRKTLRFLTSRASWYCDFALSLLFVYKRCIKSSAPFMSCRLDIHTNRYMYCKLTQEMIAVWHRQSIMTLRL